MIYTRTRIMDCNRKLVTIMKNVKVYKEALEEACATVVVFYSQCTKRTHLRLWMKNNLNNINGC